MVLIVPLGGDVQTAMIDLATLYFSVLACLGLSAARLLPKSFLNVKSTSSLCFLVILDCFVHTEKDCGYALGSSIQLLDSPYLIDNSFIGCQFQLYHRLFRIF